jgi:dGTP triphosphohydrolase
MKIRNPYLERALILAFKGFQRLAEKTQVYTPENGRVEIVKTRLTHSQEVANSVMVIVSSLSQKLNIPIYEIDYMGSVENVALLHDIGHPPFGHEGATLINNFFIEKGLKEGFSDNNNNLICIEKGDLDISNHVLASLIKYPEKLYGYQKEKYIPLLKNEIANDVTQFFKFKINLKNQTKTISCQIMDIADENSYTCSDLADFFCSGGKVSLVEIKKLNGYNSLNSNVLKMLTTMINTVNNASKSEIKVYFNNLMQEFNDSYTLTDEGLVVDNEDLITFRNFLLEIEVEFFIKPLNKEPLAADNLAMLSDFLEYTFEEEYYPSKTYKERIENSKNHEEYLRNLRDMVTEVSDWYVIKYFQKRNSGELA